MTSGNTHVDKKNFDSEGNFQDEGMVKASSSPEMKANIFSKILFYWVQPLFHRASDLHKEGKALELTDLLNLPSIDLGGRLSSKFEGAWEREGKEATVKNAVRVVMGRKFILAGFIKLFNTCVQFTFPLLLSAILEFIEQTQAGEFRDEDTPWYDRYRGYWLSAILFSAMATKAVTENVYFHFVYRSAYQARVAISLAVYNKALRLASAERHGQTLGELINLMQVDATKVEMFVPQFHVLWDGLLQIIGYMVILYTLIGWPCFAGLGVMVLAGPVQGVIMKRLFGLNREMAQYTDARVKTTNEAIQGIRCVKMYTWENSFKSLIFKSRDIELNFLGKVAYLRGFSRAYMGALPGIVAVTSFGFYAFFYDSATIKASHLFAALVAFDQLRFPLLFYPMSLAQLAQAQVSAKRLENFLGLKEITRKEKRKSEKKVNNTGSEVADEPSYNSEDTSIKTGEIMLKDTTIYWRDPLIPIKTSNSDDDNSNSLINESERSIKIKVSLKEEGDDRVDSESQTEERKLTYPKAIMSNMSLNIEPGELCAIVGRVGSGKTTICSAILNEAVIGSGSISLNGNVAYVAQTSWILNATLRDNITFGLPYEKKKYDKIILACQLTHDLALLDFGDLTEIGENGINLSGGQRQRVSIARAAYSDADIIVLDDPLSALDPEVAKKVFDECIVRLMREKTRVLVTNQIQFLRFCNSVIAVGKGRIIEQGTFDELSTKKNGEVLRLLDDLKSSKKNESSVETLKDEFSGRDRSDSNASSVGRRRGDSISAEDTLPKNNEKKGNAGLVTQEERNVGAVAWHAYKRYIQCGGGYVRFIFAYFMFVLCTANGLLNNAWISLWTADSDYKRHSRTYYLGLYALFSIALGLFTFLRSYFLAKFGVRASSELHNNLLGSVLNAPMSFFDTTPTGRIISRFSKDMYSIDFEISDMLDFFLFCGLTVVVSLGTITVITPYFGIALLPILFVYVRVLNYFREVSRETKRLDSISRSPVFAHFSETLGGLGIIRAYGQSGRFINEFEQKININTCAYYNNKSADRWLSVRLELLGAAIGGLAGMFVSNVVIANAASGAESGNNFASVAGLSLTYAVSVTGLLNWVVRTFAQLEAAMNAAERILYYTEKIPQEAPSTLKEMEALKQKDDSFEGKDSLVVPAKIAVIAKGVDNLKPDWPSTGNIILKDLKMRYRPGNPLVLKGLTLSIKGGERVGVVGRTGSGKSSLLLALLRIVEPSFDTGKGFSYDDAPIEIDGVDVLRIGLTDLRSKVGIIPQNPVLFSGTIRSNMDTFNEYTDAEIWNALDRCGMKSTIEANMPLELLEAPVAEYGENLSQGQRQLLCLGRSLLKKCQILLLDEATSSVDYETDAAIQSTLRKDFKGCTVLTIAHRVNTIMDSDKILVMKDGLVAEYAPPQELLKDKTSIFSDIVKHSQSEKL